MAGRLTNRDMDQLESWIGTGLKTFTLLYNITKDGCDPAVFHQKCNFQGPTVTVVYNKHKSVFGGYTSQSWTDSSESVHVTDNEAFLYQLYFSGRAKATKFPIKTPNRAIVTNMSVGPLFGHVSEGDDLRTFNDTIVNRGNIFPLNGHMSGFGTNYDNQGLKSSDVNNDCMEAEELEVYKVTDGQRKTTLEKPWRQTKELNAELLTALTKEIEGFQPPSELCVSDYRLLMLGPVGAGKSSFYNTVNSVFKGRVSHTAICGVNQHSTTTQYTPYSVQKKTSSKPKFLLCDTRGLEETMGINSMECSFLIGGHVPDYYTFNPSVHLSLDSNELALKPNLGSKVHCVMFVVDGSTVDAISEKILGKLMDMKMLIVQKGIPLVILLTKIDELNSHLCENLANVFRDHKVKEKVDKVSKLFGVPPNHVLPVKNYVHECELDVTVSALALLALRKALYCAEDHLDYLSTRLRTSVTMTTVNRDDDARGSDVA